MSTPVHSQSSISFNFSKFTPGDASLTLQGDAKIYNDGILALPNDPAVGKTTSRALYASPVPIWDKTTGNVASFVTSFSFVVTDYLDYQPSDGLVFFLAPWGTDIPPNSSGASLGINDENYGYNRFIAVEFDSFINTIDPNYIHIGINVNSVISLKTVKWNRTSGSKEKVTIKYDSLSKTLKVVVTHEDGQITTIDQEVDLKAILSEKVSVGFSATTWDTFRERHDVHSWSFNSTLEGSSA